MRKVSNRIVSVVLIVILLGSQFAFAAEPSISITLLGEVVGSGTAEMKGPFDRWIPLNGKTYPLIDGAVLKSKNGSMSVLFKDTARMEIGENTDLMVNGPLNQYHVALRAGSLGFTAPQGTSFTVVTPNATVFSQVQSQTIQKVNLATLDTVRGVVRYDGKGTSIIGVTGTLVLKEGPGAGAQTITAGEALYIAEDGSRRIIPAQQIQQPPRGPVPVAAIGNTVVIAPFGVLGMALLVGAGAYAVSEELKVVSPSGFSIQ